MLLFPPSVVVQSLGGQIRGRPTFAARVEDAKVGGVGDGRAKELVVGAKPHFLQEDHIVITMSYHFAQGSETSLTLRRERPVEAPRVEVQHAQHIGICNRKRLVPKVPNTWELRVVRKRSRHVHVTY